MVKVFKNIRKRTLADGKFSKYLAYAIGEIVLVVVGILIALAINNHNEKRLKLEKEQVYLAGLRSEFQTSNLKLEELIRVNRQNYEGAKVIAEYMSGAKRTPGEKEFSELLYHTFAFDIAFNPNNSLLNEMISSGSLRDLSSADLRISLTNWISTLEDIAKQETELAVRRENVLEMFQNSEYSIRTILDLTGISTGQIGVSSGKNIVSNLGLLNSRKFENGIFMFILSAQATETSHYLPLLQEIENILTLLTDNIET